MKLQFRPDSDNQAKLAGSVLKWITRDFTVCHCYFVQGTECCPLADGTAAHRWLAVPTGSERGQLTLPSLVWIIPLKSPGLTAVQFARLKLLVWSKGQEWHFTHFIYLLIKQAFANCFWLSNSSAHGTFGYACLRTIHSSFISVFVWGKNR